jgi:prepilin-type N-terminal cleavage/methylation domain-containing protein
MKIETRKNAGFTLVEILTVAGIIGLVAVIAIPNFAKATTSSKRNICLTNLRKIDDAKEQWAMQTGRANGTSTDAHVGEIDEYTRKAALMACPAGGDYAYGPVGEPATCTVDGHVIE